MVARLGGGVTGDGDGEGASRRGAFDGVGGGSGGSGVAELM